MLFERGDIVLLPFPFADLSHSKKRPVVVLSTPDAYGDFIGLAMTSRGQHSHLLAVTAMDYLSEPLPKSTWIRTDKIFSFNDSLVIKTIGRLREELMLRAIHALCKVVGKTPLVKGTARQSVDLYHGQ